MSSHSHIIHIQLQRVDDHPFQYGQAGMLGVPSAWKWKLHCAAPFVSQCRTGPCVKWLGAWKKVHLFFQDHKSGPNPTAAPLQAGIPYNTNNWRSDLCWFQTKSPICSSFLTQDTSCESDSLPPKNSAHPQNPFLTSTLNRRHPLTYVVFVRETTGHGWCQVQAMRIHKDPNIGFALPRMHGQKPEQLASLLSGEHIEYA